MLVRMPDPGAVSRLDEVSRAARAAEASGEDAAAGEAWRRYRLIRDAARDPDELLAEGIALSLSAMELAASVRTPG
jgi:negative regulator of sigma E activity